MTTTDKVVLGALGALLAYETWTLVNNERDDTISETLWRASRRPLVPFALGCVVSHFVWQSQDVYDRLGDKVADTLGVKA